jgi:hypothetical protein
MEGEKYQITPELMDRLLAGSDVDYLDPLAQAGGGHTYAGQWIAAMQPVSLPQEDRPDEPPAPLPDNVADTTDLLVLVQYRLDKVIAPVAGLRSALLWEGASAVASILAVTLILWFLVRRANYSGVDRGENRQNAPSYADTISAR